MPDTLPAVEGDRLPCSLAGFEHICLELIREEESKGRPYTELTGVLRNAVRLAREHGRCAERASALQRAREERDAAVKRSEKAERERDDAIAKADKAVSDLAYIRNSAHAEEKQHVKRAEKAEEDARLLRQQVDNLTAELTNTQVRSASFAEQIERAEEKLRATHANTLRQSRSSGNGLRELTSIHPERSQA